ncbi:E-selectin-like [Diadema setosum]|uniref:E-selectin-like n=1 Tax=Diadema setosum TaxID=31175 RepID=UPI003B3B4B0B
MAAPDGTLRGAHQKSKEYDLPLVKLVDGSSPLDGMVVLESDKYMCYDGFNLEAADLVCRELGFPAVKNYSAQPISGAATLKLTDWFLYSTGCQSARAKDCLSQGTECPSNKAVKLRCREPGFRGCYPDHRYISLASSVLGFNVYSDEECVSTCRGKPENPDIVMTDEMRCRCFRSEEYTNFISGVTCAHSWIPQTSLESGSKAHCLFNLSVGFCKHPCPVSDGYWDSNNTSFGSKVTLTCDEGFTLNDRATLQCGRPGWSTYFPVWNASVPSCLAAGNVTNGKEKHNAEISTTPSQRDSTSRISSE